MRDYKVEFEKRVNFIKSVLAESGAKGSVYGNSGGKDSALVGILCKAACDNTVGIILPCTSKRNYDEDISVEDDHRLLRVMRKSKNTPILVLSSQSEHKHHLETLKAGAHAYMCPPYSLEECLAQAQSLMQMYMESHPNEHKCFTLAFGKDLIIDPEKRKVFLKGKELHFTRKEFDLLFCLASSPGKVFTREQ